MPKILIFMLAFILILSGCSHDKVEPKEPLNLEEAKIKAVQFINTNLMRPGNEVSIKEIVVEEDLYNHLLASQGMYKIVVNLPDGQELTSYLSKDGGKFFSQVMDVAEVESERAAQNPQTPAADVVPAIAIPKLDKPEVELFVMSHCPFGTQIEKGILPVLDELGDQIDFKLKFCDYAMHGEKEIKEQLNQHCIQENEPNKLSDYLYCFLESGDGEDCLIKAKINKTKLYACAAATDEEFKITENFTNKVGYRGQFPGFDVYKVDTQKYGIAGSPGAAINGVKMGGSSCSSNDDCHAGEVCVQGRSGMTCSLQRSPESLKQAICDTFNTQPAACTKTLSSASPSSGFGFSGAGADASGGCGG